MWMQIASRMATFLKVLETLKVSEAHRAMWYTSGTLEPNPTGRISDCIMPCTPRNCPKGTFATQWFWLSNTCVPCHPGGISSKTIQHVYYTRHHQLLKQVLARITCQNTYALPCNFLFFFSKHGREPKTKPPQRCIRPRSSLKIQAFEPPLVLGLWNHGQMQQVWLKTQLHLQVGSMQHWFFSRISHSVQPVGRPAVATWQACAQQYCISTTSTNPKSFQKCKPVRDWQWSLIWMPSQSSTERDTIMCIVFRIMLRPPHWRLHCSLTKLSDTHTWISMSIAFCFMLEVDFPSAQTAILRIPLSVHYFETKDW